MTHVRGLLASLRNTLESFSAMVSLTSFLKINADLPSSPFIRVATLMNTNRDDIQNYRKMNLGMPAEPKAMNPNIWPNTGNYSGKIHEYI